MNFNEQIATHFRAVFFGGNWTDVDLKSLLKDVTWKEATTQIQNLNTIAMLVFHIDYFVSAVLKVLESEPLDASDKLSFDLGPIGSEAEWQGLINKTLTEAEMFASKVEQLENAHFFGDFTDVKYGNYYYNIHGIIEHTHYHLGQISLIKKMIRNQGV